MHHYMLHTTNLALTAEGRATAERNREAAYSQGSRARGGRLASFTGAFGGVEGKVMPREKLTTRYGSVAVLDVNGALCSGDMDLVCWMMGGVPSQWIEEDAKSLTEDATVDTVVMRLSTPGGAIARFSAVADAILALGESKRVIAVVDDAAYSMGAVLSALADEVYITPSGGMGNIGVLCGPFFDRTKSYEEAGVSVFYACAPAGKASGNYGAPVPDEFKETMNTAARAWYETFAGYFSRRGLSIADIDAMNGAVYAAADAVTMGLADAVKSFDEVLIPLIAGTAPDRLDPTTQTAARGALPRAKPAQVHKELTMKLTAPQWAGLTADAIREARPELITEIAATGKAAAPEPASLADLETHFKGESEFVLDSLRAKETLPAAQARFVGVLRSRLDQANAKVSELEKAKPDASGSAAVALAAQKVAAVTTIDASGLPSNQPEAKGACPYKTGDEAINAIRKANGMSYGKAAIKAKADFPALFAD